MKFTEFKEQKTLTIRVPAYLHAILVALSQRRKTSINKLVVEAIIKSFAS